MSNNAYHTGASLIIFFIAGLFVAQASIAQLPQVKTAVDRKNILIGEQIQYKVQTSMPDNTFRLTWFSTPDSFGSFIVVSEKKIDSSVSNGNIVLSQELTLTSFDSGRKVIPPLRLIAEPLDADSSYSLFTDTIPINVSFSPLDSVKTFHDIKNIIEVEKKWPWWVWLLIGLGVLIIIFLIIFLRRVFGRKENRADLIVAKLTPYDEAMQSLKNLRKKELLQHNVKEYHAELSEIFKRYITRKTNTYKLHLTSDEILLEVNEYGLNRDQLAGFANSLRMSNAVKFAKFIPPDDESEKCLDQTKQVIIQINNYLNTKKESAV